MVNHVASGKSVEASGRTVEQAVEEALSRLGRTRDEVEIQVLRESSRGVLGFGAHDAIVRVTELVTPVAQPAVEQQPSPVSAAQDEERVAQRLAEADEEELELDDDFVFDEDDEEESYEAPRATAIVDDDEFATLARDVLLELLEQMEVIGDVLAAWVEAEDPSDKPTLMLDIIGDDMGLLIGRRGETLRDLQYILRLIVARRAGGARTNNIIVDVEGYKQRREQNIRQLARRMADRVITTGHPVHMEPMNPYERRLVHLEIRQMKGVNSKSSGEGENRKVGIFPA
jgi:spoIIIJ-associated protein